MKFASMFQKETTIPYGKHDADVSCFKRYEEFSGEGESMPDWKAGMKLEVLDPLDTWKELRVGTVLDILNDGFLKVRKDLNIKKKFG